MPVFLSQISIIPVFRKDVCIQMINGKKIKKFISFAAAAALILSFASGCNGGAGTEAEEEISLNTINRTESDVTSSGNAEESGSQTRALTADEDYYSTFTGSDITGSDGNALASAPDETLSSEQMQAINDAMTAPPVTAVTNPPVVVPAPSVKREDKYAYNQLSQDEKYLYDAIVENVERMNGKVPNASFLETEYWARIYGLVYNQEPQLFWMAPTLRTGRLFYTETDHEKINAMQSQIDSSVSKLMAEINGKASAYDKLLVIHDYLVYNCTFTMDESDPYTTTIYNAFKNGTSGQGSIQCAGYARTVQYLCDMAGIKCMTVTGINEKGSSHAWNVVDVDGKWYNMDVTWDDPILEKTDVTNNGYAFFLATDSQILEITHFKHNQLIFSTGESLTYFAPPACNDAAMNYFVKNGLVCNDEASADSALKAGLENAAGKKLRTVQVKCGSKAVYDAIKGKLSSYQTFAKEKNSSVKGIADNCKDSMLLIDVAVVYE